MHYGGTASPIVPLTRRVDSVAKQELKQREAQADHVGRHRGVRLGMVEELRGPV
jgi:hypothetical protein